MKSKKPSHAKCALCHAKLNAVPKRGTAGMRKLAKTEKRPERVFGGVLCGSCTRLVLKEHTRLKSGAIAKEDLDLRRAAYVNALK
jgi:large subunit ribosomal protein L34e